MPKISVLPANSALTGTEKVAAVQSGVTVEVTTQEIADLASGSGITALTGDVTASGTGSVAATLATVNANVGAFGGATQSVQVTFNAKGLATAAANVSITPAVGSITGLGTGVGTALAVNVGSAGAPVVNGGALGTPSSGNGSNITNVNAATLGGATFAAPGAIGGGTPAAGSFTTITASGSIFGVPGVGVIGYSFAGDTDTGFGNNSGDVFDIYTGGTLRSRHSSTRFEVTTGVTFDTNIGVGIFDAASRFVGIAAGTTAKSQIFFTASVAPTAPNDGDFWVEAVAGPQWRIGGVTVGLTSGGGGTVTSVGFTGGLITVASATTTPALTVAGTSGGIPYFSSASTWASSAALAANSLVKGGGAGTAPSTITTGTGVLTALGVNVGSAGAPVLFNGAGGTPSSLTLTSATGLTAAGGGTGQSTYTKGDILASPGSNTLNKLGVGTDGQVMTADAASTNGIKWATATGSEVLLETLTASTSASLTTSVSWSGYTSIKFVFLNVLPASAGNSLQMQVIVGVAQTTDYLNSGFSSTNGGALSFNNATSSIVIGGGNTLGNTNPGASAVVTLANIASTTQRTVATGTGTGVTNGAQTANVFVVGGWWDGGNNAISGVKILMSSGNITSGSIQVFGIV